MKHLCLVFALLFAASQASAADLTVTVGDAAGAPVAHAVVTWTPANAVAISAAERARSFVMTQKNVQFAPFVLAVPVGATVSFPNQDRVNHHVYSFSPVQPFQFPLYGKGKAHTLKFERPGTVALGCNIHDSMSAYVRVVSTPYYATTDATGRIVLKNVPEGAGSLAVWHPTLDAPQHQMARNLNLGKAAVTQAFSIRVSRIAPSRGQD